MRQIFFLLSVLVHFVLLMLLLGVKPEIRPVEIPKVRTVEIAPKEKLYLPVMKAKPAVTLPKTRKRKIVVKPFKIESPEGNGDKRALKGAEGKRENIPEIDRNNLNNNGPYISRDKVEEEAVKEFKEEIKKDKELLFNSKIAKEVIEKGKPKHQVRSPLGTGGVQFNGNRGFFSKEGDGITAHGGAAFLNLNGYDITPWAMRTIYRIKRNWIPPEAVKLGIKGEVKIYLEIERDGTISVMKIAKSSGVNAYDRSAVAALTSSVPFMRLPPDFPNFNLEVFFIFQYL